jgi:anti-anti-sigma factor
MTILGTSYRVREDGSLTIRVERAGDTLVVRALGEVDLATTKTFEGELRRALGCDVAAVFLDLGKLDFIDSTGLRALLSVAKRSRTSKNRLWILPPSAPVQRVIEQSGLAAYLTLH